MNPSPSTRRARHLAAGAAAALAAALALVLFLALGTGDRHRPAASPSTGTAPPLQLNSLQPSASLSAGAFDMAAAEHLITARGYTPEPSKGNLPGPLRVILGVCSGSINGRCMEGFFFYGNRFAGVSDATGDRWYLTIVGQNGSTVTLGYPTQLPGDPACCPSGPSTIRHFTWDGAHVVAGTAAPPSARYPAGPVPTVITHGGPTE